MRKFLVLFLVVALVMGLSAACFSVEESEQRSQETTRSDSMMHKNMMMQEGMIHSGMKMQEGQKEGGHLMQGMMMKSMMEKSLVATEDGGVVVLIGNKLLKYDKNLNLQKEVEIKIDASDMKEKMMQMKEKHHKCSGMLQQENKQETPVETQRR